LPRTDYFFATAWNAKNKTLKVREVLEEVAEHIYPEQKQALVEGFLALHGSDSVAIARAKANLEALLQQNKIGRPGVLARYLFPDYRLVVRDLITQLGIREARQSLVGAMRGKPDLEECARLITIYFDRLLAWNAETGWEKVVDTGIWTQPIYESGKDLTEAISRLKELLGRGAPYTSYAQVIAFFKPIGEELQTRYAQNSVMVGCIEPFKYAVIQAQ
jgi:hypothetical protein